MGGGNETMAGKAPVFGDRYLNLAMDELSKNQLIDLAIDLCRAEIGETTTNEEILEWVQAKMNVVWRHRGDKPKNLKSIYDLRKRVSDEYRARIATT
jgi:hypothetical protein